MVSPLSSRTGTPVKWGQGPKIQKAEKRTAESAMTDGFVEKIKEYAKQDAKQGVYMSKGFIQFRLARMEQCVSPDRDGPKAEVMSAIQAALREPHPLLQALEKMLEKLSGGGSANLKISGVQQAAEVYAPNGENIASYNSLGGGWTDIPGGPGGDESGPDSGSVRRSSGGSPGLAGRAMAGPKIRG